MKRAGFTMIELIFVIVILGILAAVAIPKLAATRSDAEIAKMSTNAATIVSDYGSRFTARGDFNASTEWGDVTNVPLMADGGAASADANETVDTKVVLADSAGNECIGFIGVASGTVYEGLTVSDEGSTSAVCDAVETKVANLIKTHHFGGTGVQ